MKPGNLSCALAASAALLIGGSAYAGDPQQLNCYATGGVSPTHTSIFLAGSTALNPALAVLAPIADAAGYSLVYWNAGSCGALQNLSSSSPNKMPASTTKATDLVYYALDTASSTWKPVPCTNSDGPTGAATPITIDVDMSDVDARLCPGFVNKKPGDAGNLPAGYVDYSVANGNSTPVNAMVFAVPGDSQQNAISAEQAYLIFGMGPNSGVTPWNDAAETTRHVRNNGSGTRAMLNYSIGRIDQGGQNGQGNATHGWYGNDDGGAGTIVTNLNNANGSAATANPHIGILGMNDILLAAATIKIKPLAFRAFNQFAAFFPSSTQTSKDMRNIRDGHYKIWGHVHMITPTTASDNAKYFINLLVGADAIDGVIASKLTPDCAMHVTHDIEGGDQKPYSPAHPCDCYFEFKATGTAPTTCKSCTKDADCTTAGATHCDLHGSVGYCEDK